MHACFHKDFNIYQYWFISIYRDIFCRYIDTPNVESMTALVHMYIRRWPSKCLTAKISLLYIIVSLCMRKLTKWCAPSEDSDQPGHPTSLISLLCPREERLGPLLPFEHIAKTLIRLGGFPGWSESSLGAYVILLVLSCGGPYTSHVTRKPVFRVFDQLRLKPACSATETSLGLEISAIASRGIILSRQRKQKHWSYCADAHADPVFEISASPTLAMPLSG